MPDILPRGVPARARTRGGTIIRAASEPVNQVFVAAKAAPTSSSKHPTSAIQDLRRSVAAEAAPTSAG